MKPGHVALALGSFYLLLGAACGRRAEPVGQAETTGATVLPAETVRPAAVPAPAAVSALGGSDRAAAGPGTREVAPPPVNPGSPWPAATAPVATLAVPGIVEDRYPAGRGTLSVVAAPNLAANLGDAGASASGASSEATPVETAPADAVPARPPSAADRQPWTGAAVGP